MPWIRLVKESSQSKIAPLSSEMKMQYDNGKKRLMKALFDPHIGVHSPFIIAKCMDDTTKIRTDQAHWRRAPHYPMFVPCNPVTRDRAVFRCPDLSPTGNSYMVSQFGGTLSKLHSEVTSMILCNNIANPDDAYVLEELLQNFAGLSWCLLNQSIGPSGANENQRKHTNHCVIVHFYHGMANVLRQ